MAWTTLSFPFGSILTSTKMTQLYDNLTAIMNGDSGAPRLMPEAHFSYSVGSDYNSRFIDTTGRERDAIKYNTSATQALSRRAQVRLPQNMKGSLRLAFKLGVSDAGASVAAQVYRNGTSVTSYYALSGPGTVYYYEDVGSWQGGDLLEFYASGTVVPYGYGVDATLKFMVNSYPPLLTPVIASTFNNASVVNWS